MKTEKATDVGELLGQVFDRGRADLRADLAKQDREDVYERLKRGFIFHMTDWAVDLRRLHALMEAPDAWSPKQATTCVMAFLYHVLPHLNAAGHLLLDEVPDAFAEDETAKLLESFNKSENPGR